MKIATEKGAPVTNPADDYERLIKPIEDRMIRSVWRIVRNSEDVDDAFQEGLARIWRRWERIRRHPNPQALILRIGINAAYDCLRRKARCRKAEALGDIGEMRLVQPDEGSAAFGTEESRAALCAAISRLPKNQGLAVHMRFIEEQSYEAIAGALGCRETAARKHVSRGIKKLKDLLPRPMDGMPAS